MGWEEEMKKNFLIGILCTVFLVLGFVSFTQKTSSVETTESTETEELAETEASDELVESTDEGTDEQSNKRKLTKATSTKKLTIKRFFARIKDGANGSELVSLPRSEYRISYIHEGKETFIVGRGITNEKGEIVDIPEVDIPVEVTSIRFKYYLGNEKRGYIQKYNQFSYQFIVGQSISKKATVTIDGQSNFWVGSASDPDKYFYNFQAARLNYYYDQAVEEFSALVKNVNTLLPGTAKFEVAPINMNFKQGEYVDDHNYFCRNGHDKKGVADIVISDRTDRMYSEQAVKSKVMHEWTHWNSYRETQMGMPWTGNDKTGYREGWAYLVGHLFADNYDCSNKDLLVQNDNKNGENRYFGKANSTTAEHVLYDLVDVLSTDEEFSLSQRFLDEEQDELSQRKLNLGILHTIMVDSKASSLKEFLNYMEDNYILTASDKKKYEKVLEVNGLARDGSYLFDQNKSSMESTDIK